MKKSLLSIVFVFGIYISSFAIDLTGDWSGTRFQYDESKSKYIAEFEYQYHLKQVGNQVSGTAYIRSQGDKYAELSVRGFVEGNQFYFEEYEVLHATRTEGFLWCLKKGVLDIKEEDGKLSLSGATPSFVETYGFECSGGVTQLSKQKSNLSEKEIKEIADKDYEPTITVHPNPFIEQTTISVENEKTQPLSIDIVDIQGRIISSLENKTLDKGFYQYTFLPKTDANSSYYYVRIRKGEKTVSRPIQKIIGKIDLK